MRFVDTNVLLYSISGDPDEAAKAAAATEALRSADLALSVQVLQEFIVHATHAQRSGVLLHEDALALVVSAAASAARWHISYWDAAVIEAARALWCTQVLTEDLNTGQNFSGIVAVNPFTE